MFDIVGVMVLLFTAAIGTWLAIRARRATNRILKWVGLVFSSILTVLCTVVLAVVLVGFYKFNFPPSRPPVIEVQLARTPDQVARGARFAAYCPFCHSPTGKVPLIGQNFSEGGPPIGTLYASNLTPAGEIKDWSDGEVIRAIREGVHRNGRPLIIMPAEVFRYLSDTDVQAIVAYLRTQPAAGTPTPPTRLNVLGAVFIGAGLAPTSAQAPITEPVVAPPEGPTLEYGKYLVSILGCRLCHGENLAGLPPGKPGPPAGPNLTLVLPKWTLEEFIHTLRTGVDPYSRTLGEGMPWKQISAFGNDADLTAIYAYLHDLTPAEGPK